MTVEQPFPLDACAAVKELLLSSPELITVALQRFRPPPLFQDRAELTSQDGEIISHGLRLREQTGMPFPSAIATHLLVEATPSSALVRAMLYHQPHQANISCSRSEVLSGALDRLVASEEPTNFLSLCSRVSTASGQGLHIPMLDFHIRPSSRARSLVQQVLREIAPYHGWLLNSGKSYHFLGGKLLADDEQRVFLAQALLLAPITDRNWIAHQLWDGQCSLRLSGNPRSGFGVPTIEARVRY